MRPSRAKSSGRSKIVAEGSQIVEMNRADAHENSHRIHHQGISIPVEQHSAPSARYTRLPTEAANFNQQEQGSASVGKRTTQDVTLASTSNQCNHSGPASSLLVVPGGNDPGLRPFEGMYFFGGV